MLGAADIQIDTARFIPAHPVMFRFFSDEPLIVMRIAEAQVIPARACPLRHCVGLAHGFVRVTDPFAGPCPRRFARADRLVIVQQRRHQGQLLLVQGSPQ